MDRQQLYICLKPQCGAQKIVHEKDWNTLHPKHIRKDFSEFQRSLQLNINIKNLRNFISQSFNPLSQERVNQVSAAIVQRAETFKQWVFSIQNQPITNVDQILQNVELLINSQNLEDLIRIDHSFIQQLLKQTQVEAIEHLIKSQLQQLQQEHYQNYWQQNFNQVADWIELILKSLVDTIYTDPNKGIIAQIEGKQIQVTDANQQQIDYLSTLEQNQKEHQQFQQLYTINESNLKGEIFQLQRNVQELTNIVNEKEEFIRKIQLKYQKKQDKLYRNSIQFQQINKELSASKQHENEIESTMSVLIESVTTKEEQIDGHIRKYKELQQVEIGKENRLRQLQVTIDNQEKQLSRLALLNNEKDQELKLAKQHQKKMESTITELKGGLTAKDAKIQSHIKQQNEIEQQNLDLKKALEQNKKAIADQNQKFNDQRRQHQETIDYQQKQLSVAKQQEIETQTTIMELIQSISSKNDQIQNPTIEQGEIQQENAGLKNAEQQIRILTREIIRQNDRSKDQAIIIENRIRQLQEANNNQQLIISKLTQKIKEKDKKMNEVKQKILQYQSIYIFLKITRGM